MRISDWSSDVCSSDLMTLGHDHYPAGHIEKRATQPIFILPEHPVRRQILDIFANTTSRGGSAFISHVSSFTNSATPSRSMVRWSKAVRSEEHTSELQSLMRISYAYFCLKKKKKQ